MIHILYIASRAELGGGESYLLAVFRHLDRARFTPIVWLPAEGPFRQALADIGVETWVMPVDYGWFAPPLPWYRFLSGLPGRVREIAAFIRARGVRLVHTNSNLILEGALAAQLAGVPHVHIVHAYFDPDQPLWQRLRFDAASFATLVADLSARVVAVSPALGEIWRADIGSDKLRIIPNGLPLERYDRARLMPRAAVRAALGLPEDAPVFIAAGRLDPEKGFEHYLEAAARTRTGHPDAHFLLAGGTDDAGYLAALQERARDVGMGGCFHFLGYRTDLPDLLAASDVFVLTSRREGGPYVLLEAMACGCAAVSTRCGGLVPDLVKPDDTGHLIDYGDVAALTTVMTRLLEQPEERVRVAAHAQTLVRSQYDERAGVTRLMAAYEEALPLVSGRHRHIVEMFLLAATESGDLGLRVTLLEERMKKAERAAQLLLDNPLMRLLRRMTGRHPPH